MAGHILKRGRRSCHRGTAAPSLMAGPGGPVTPRECVARTWTRGARFIAIVRRLCPVPVSHRQAASHRALPGRAGRSRDPSTVITRTRCRPMGLGRPGERVLKTPAGGLCGLSPGRVTSTSRRDRSSQVSTMISVPARRSRIPSVTSGSNTSHAGGAPRLPCLGACDRSFSGDSALPAGTTS
jgi:hypothetical protein